MLRKHICFLVLSDAAALYSPLCFKSRLFKPLPLVNTQSALIGQLTHACLSQHCSPSLKPLHCIFVYISVFVLHQFFSFTSFCFVYVSLFLFTSLFCQFIFVYFFPFTSLLQMPLCFCLHLCFSFMSLCFCLFFVAFLFYVSLFLFTALCFCLYVFFFTLFLLRSICFGLHCFVFVYIALFYLNISLPVLRCPLHLQIWLSRFKPLASPLPHLIYLPLFSLPHMYLCLFCHISALLLIIAGFNDFRISCLTDGNRPSLIEACE